MRGVTLLYLRGARPVRRARARAGRAERRREPTARGGDVLEDTPAGAREQGDAHRHGDEGQERGAADRVVGVHHGGGGTRHSGALVEVGL